MKKNHYKKTLTERLQLNTHLHSQAIVLVILVKMFSFYKRVVSNNKFY